MDARTSNAVRLIGVAVSVGCAVVAFQEKTRRIPPTGTWWLLVACVVVSALWSLGLALRAADPPLARHRMQAWRLILGILLTILAAAAFSYASYNLYLSWEPSFDRTWITWICAAVVMAVGLDIASGPRERSRAGMTVGLAIACLCLVVIAGVYRLWNIADFPGEAGGIQIEDFQTGQWGWWYQNGQGRVRWEYLSHQWLAGLGIWLGGPTMVAMRVPFAAVSALKIIPFFIWLFWQVGAPGALIASALLAFSSWDVVMSRTANNHNAFIVATMFALMAGPLRRGRLSAYVAVGLLCGYLVHEYVAYRPLIFLSLFGTAWLSLRDRQARWITRLSRPLLPIAILAAMAAPLFLGRLAGPDRLWEEYFNGWNRARAIQPYYNPEDSWRITTAKRVERSFDALSLFFFTGDGHPGRNTRHPLLDPVGATLVLVGVGCAVARAFDPVFLFTIVGLAGTLVGSLVLTGNFDVARVGGAVPYVYACIGYGAASLIEIARRHGRAMRVAAWLVLLGAVVWAGYRNTQVLRGYWSSPAVQRALRNNLAFLSGWLRQNAREDEQVVALAPGFHHVLQDNDAAWLRGRQMRGLATWDLDAMLDYWQEHPDKTLLVLFAGEGTLSTQRYMEVLLPGLQLEYRTDPLHLGADIAFAHVDHTPSQLQTARALLRCRGLQVKFALLDRSGASVFASEGMAPFVEVGAIPGTLRNEIIRREPARVTATFSGDITIAKPGEYRFTSEVYPGSGELKIDGALASGGGQGAVGLQAGRHRIELRTTFDPDPIAMVARLYWQGPDSDNKREIMPFYRLTDPDPACVATAATAGVANVPAVNP